MRNRLLVERAVRLPGSGELGQRGHPLLIRGEKSGGTKPRGDWFPAGMTVEGREQFAAVVVASEKISNAAIDRMSGASGVFSFDHTQGGFHRGCSRSACWFSYMT